MKVYRILTPGGYLLRRVECDIYEQAWSFGQSHYSAFRVETETDTAWLKAYQQGKVSVDNKLWA